MICLSSKSTLTYVDEVFASLLFKPFFFLSFPQTTFTFQSKTSGWSRRPWCAQNTFNICHRVKWLYRPANEMSQMFENCLALLPSSKNAFPFLIWSSTLLSSSFPPNFPGSTFPLFVLFTVHILGTVRQAGRACVVCRLVGE